MIVKYLMYINTLLDKILQFTDYHSIWRSFIKWILGLNTKVIRWRIIHTKSVVSFPQVKKQLMYRT